MKLNTRRSICSMLMFMILVVSLNIRQTFVAKTTGGNVAQDLEVPLLKVSSNGDNIDSLPAKNSELIHGPFSAEELFSLKPVDTGEVIDKVPSNFSLASTVVLLSFREIAVGGALKTGSLIVEVDRLEVIKGANGSEVGRFLEIAINPHVLGFTSYGGYIPEVNQWTYLDRTKHRYFRVFSNGIGASLKDQIDDPTSVRSISEESFDDVVQELRFLSYFDRRPVRDQLEQPGLNNYFERGGIFGTYLGHHLGVLYARHSPSVRRKMLPVIEQLEVSTSKPIWATGFISPLGPSFMLHGTHDDVGSAILLGLKGMRSRVWDTLDGEQHRLAAQYTGLIRMIQNNRAVAQELVRRDSFKEEITALRTLSKTWDIKNSDDERSLSLVESFLDALEDLQ